MTTPELESRRNRLAAWLRRMADREDGTAFVLRKIESGNPSECNTRARLFREIADTLEGNPTLAMLVEAKMAAPGEPLAEPTQAHPDPEPPMDPDPPPKPWRKRL